MESQFVKEMNMAKKLISVRSYDVAFAHLERAHIIGQTSVKRHTIAHLYMLKIGFLRRDFKEVIGQLIRIPFGILGSFVGVVPTGNTGGSNVSMFAKMDIPKEIEKYLSESD